MPWAADDAAESASLDRLVPAVLAFLAAGARQVLESLAQKGGDLQQHQAGQHLEGVRTVVASWVDRRCTQKKHTKSYIFYSTLLKHCRPAS